MSRKKKVWLGLAVYSPYLAILYVFFCFILREIISIFLQKQMADVAAQYLIFSGFILWGITMVTSMIGFIVCALHFNAQKIKGFRYLKWTLFLGLLWPISLPIYWHRYIWHDQRIES